jgi:hypothetical protein
LSIEILDLRAELVLYYGIGGLDLQARRFLLPAGFRSGPDGHLRHLSGTRLEELQRKVDALDQRVKADERNEELEDEKAADKPGAALP